MTNKAFAKGKFGNKRPGNGGKHGGKAGGKPGAKHGSASKFQDKRPAKYRLQEQRRLQHAGGKPAMRDAPRPPARSPGAPHAPPAEASPPAAPPAAPAAPAESSSVPASVASKPPTEDKHIPQRPTPAASPPADVGVRFTDMDLSPETQAAIAGMGFETATPIQAETIPALLDGRDVIGQAQTGTGKTAAFGVPMAEAARAGRRCLVLAPTRELAKQVQQEIRTLTAGPEVLCLIGGDPMKDQVRALQRHPTASIVGTPGRIVDHLGRNNIDLRDISMFVLDEADEMLSMGFADELDTIVAALPEERQNVLFTATLSPQIEKLAKKTLTDPVTVRIGKGAAKDVRQGYAQVAGRDRLEAVRRIILTHAPRSTILFAKTRARVDDLTDGLSDLMPEALHGGMDQSRREGVMKRFRDGATKLLVATDVAARGLDVDTVDVVLHDEPPMDADTYVHRIGRTGRAGRSGISILFIAPGKTNKLGAIRRAAGRLETYVIPDDAEVAAARSTRLVNDLNEIEPSDAARAALEAAIEAGMDPHDVALRAIEMMVAIPDAPAPDTSRPSAVALKVGKMDNIHPGAIVGVLTNAAGLRAEDVGRIDILEKMSVVEVPGDQVDKVCENLGRVRLSGRPLLPRAADDWRFKSAPKR